MEGVLIDTSDSRLLRAGGVLAARLTETDDDTLIGTSTAAAWTPRGDDPNACIGLSAAALSARLATHVAGAEPALSAAGRVLLGATALNDGQLRQYDQLLVSLSPNARASLAVALTQAMPVRARRAIARALLPHLVHQPLPLDLIDTALLFDLAQRERYDDYIRAVVLPVLAAERLAKSGMDLSPLADRTSRAIGTLSRLQGMPTSRRHLLAILTGTMPPYRWTGEEKVL
jgi:hypothetical protein